MKKILYTGLLIIMLFTTGCSNEQPNNENKQPEVNYDDLNELEKAIYDSLHASGYQMNIRYDLGEPRGIIETSVDIEQEKRFVYDANLYYFTEDDVLYQVHIENTGNIAAPVLEFINPTIHDMDLTYLLELVDGDEVLQEEGYYNIDLQGEGFNSGKLFIENGLISKIEYYAGHSNIEGNIMFTTVTFTNYNNVTVTLPNYTQIEGKESAEFLLRKFGYTITYEQDSTVYQKQSIEIIQYYAEDFFLINNTSTFYYYPETGVIKQGTNEYHIDNYLNLTLSNEFPYYIFQLLDTIASE